MRSTTDSYLLALAALVLSAGACSDGEEKASGSGGAPCVLDAGPDADPCDADGDGFRSVACGGDDCDDANKDIHPGATRRLRRRRQRLRRDRRLTFIT